jgi:hypothetical protein
LRINWRKQRSRLKFRIFEGISHGRNTFKQLRAIASGLEERGIPAARDGKWSVVQVARLLRAAGSPFGQSAMAA